MLPVSLNGALCFWSITYPGKVGNLWPFWGLPRRTRWYNNTVVCSYTFYFSGTLRESDQDNIDWSGVRDPLRRRNNAETEYAEQGWTLRSTPAWDMLRFLPERFPFELKKLFSMLERIGRLVIYLYSIVSFKVLDSGSDFFSGLHTYT